MKRIFTHLFVAVLLMLSTTSWAQFTTGKVYRIVCAGTNSVSLGASALTDVAAVSTSETDKSQQWYVTVSGSNYTFRNLGNGRYLLGNNGTSGGWALTEASNNFTVTAVNGNYAIRGASDSNGYAYMHKDAGNNIVSWESSNGNSQWTPIEVSYTDSELQAIWSAVDALVVPSATVSGYQTKLEAIFTDKACTQLNSTYAAKTVDQIKADANYLALSATLQAMVLKVKGGDWTESTVAPADRPNGNNNTNHSLWTVSDTWNNDYAKRFRVQMYEPYSIEGEITSYLRFNAHCNMDNPTGIYADGGEPIYIMVEGTIEEGAELWIAHQTGHGATGYYSNATYTRLHEGLNVVPYFNDGSQLWINYLVHTYNGNGATIAEKFPHKLSDYKPLKIHIEGGRINGYYNAIGDFRATDSGTENLWGEVDNDEDWNYYKARVALSTDFALLGHRQTPLFPFGTYESGKGAFCTYNDGGGLEYALAYHLDNITVPTTPNCYGGSGNTFGTFAGSYSGMNLDASNGKINIMLEAWDRIMYSELATMGLVSTSTMNKMNSLYPRWTSEGAAAEIYNYGEATVNGETKTYKDFCQGLDYSEYFNHHGAAVGAPSGYMSGGWRVCNYHYNTMGSIIGVIANEAGPTWGPAHEIGHQHQGVFNLNGQTEVTNNFFSNVAVWYMGMGTSRVNGSEGSLASVLGAFNTDGNDLYTNNIWAITHLYYRLWLYYHLAGNNTQFWPRLFELCRQVPLVNGGQISGETSLLRFYQHACDAAGEDLTEFFRAHGYFEIMDNRLVGDYSNATYNITQEQIDAAIKSVKDKGYPVNYAALLINDATSETTVKHDGATKRSLWDGSATADLGSVNDFIDGDIDALTNYTATVSADGTVTMSGGQGGAGFIVLNDKGELVSFSNKSTFTLNEEAKYMLASGKGSVLTVNSESETVEAEIDLATMQRDLLESLIADVEAMPIDDGTYTHVGFYTKACAADLLAAVESAKTVLASGTGFAAAYELLYTEKEKFVNSPNLSCVPFDPSLTYIITNYAYKDKTMYLSSGVRSNTGVDKTLDTSKWQFKTTGTDGVYNLYNVSGSYLAAASKSTLVSSVTDQASAAKYSLIQDSPVGTWAISVSPTAEFATLHDNSYGNVVGWEAGASASKWYLTAIEGSTNSQATQVGDELQALVAKTETLMNEVATVSLKGKVQLQADNANSAFFITSNATEAGHEPKYLLDNNVTTFFHTVWTGTSPGADHYLQIDLGEELPIDQFVLKYTNLPSSSWNVDAANTIKVQGANILDEFTDITTLTDLPTAKEGTYTSATLGAKGTNYRYIRLTVTNATGGKFDNHYYFGMSEFSLERLNSYSKVKDAYTGHITQDVVATVADKLVDAKTVIANGGDIAAAKKALQDAYDDLLLEYSGVADAKKKELQDLIDATNELIAQVGEATVIAGANVDLLGKLYAERVYDAEGTSHSDYSSAENGYNLLDGNVNTHFHSDYNTSSMVSPPSLRVDLGKGNSARKVNFNYTTRNQTGCAPTIINVYGGVAGVEYVQGEIQSSATLNAVTTPTKIVIKNLSGTNSLYFAGTSNKTDINDAVLVWEPVDEGKAGKYYLRTTDAENGYIQASTAVNASVTLGPKETAQVFHTSAPVSGGSGENAFATETLATGSDTGNLVRFVQDGKSTWLNVNTAGAAPRLGNSGTGGWTVHNVYLVTETENDTPSYDATPIATFTSGDASNPLPTGTSEKWTSTDIASTKDYRFFKFEVAESQGSNGGGYYFAISEFGFNIVGVSSVTINPEYQGLVSEDLLIETRQEVDAAVTMKNIATSEDLLQVQIDKLQAAKAALEEAMSSTSALKAQLNELLYQAQTLYVKIANENDGVIDDYYKSAIGQEDFGTLINEISEAGPLVQENVNPTAADLQTAISELGAICEKINGIIAADFAQDSRTAIEELVAKMETLFAEVADKTTVKTAIVLQTTDEDDSFYIWSNATAWDCDGIGALIDKNDDGTAKTGTFFGTTWDGGAVNSYDHYIAVDLGADVAISELSIDYTTRNSTHANQRPTAIKVLGSNDKEGEYAEITILSEGMPVGQNQKWEMASTVALDNYYRYIRFAPATEVGFFNMSDFNLYAHSAVETKDDYLPSGITGAQLFAMNAALLAGIDARDKFVTEENYNAALTVLQEQYNELLAIKNANVSDRNSLANLITETNTLVAEVAKIDGTEAKIALQCDDENAPYYIYCNAPGATNNYGGDNLGVAALLDVDEGGEPITATFLHTTYTGNSYDDELDHYLRVDMGEEVAVETFKFRYTPRIGNTNNAPLVMLIEGSNDCVNFEEITTLTDMATTYQSGEITNGKAYRYIRFMVKDTHNHSAYNGHPFFAMSHFEMTACKTVAVSEEYASPNLPLSVVVAANNEAVDGTTVNEQFYVTQGLYDSTVAELQDAYDALAAAIALKNIPVKLTTDVNNPVLYKIKINRTATTVLQFDNATKQVAVADEYVGNKYQAWYFMQGTDTESNDDILILPYWNEGAANTALRLGAASTGNATAAVWAVESGDASKTKQNWCITFDTGNTAEGWWNIRPEGKDNYFSNNGGVGNKMGFWNSSSDDGSEFQFVLDETDYSLSDAYYALLNQYNDCGGEVTYGTIIGTYSEVTGTAYNTAYNTAAILLEAKSSTDDEYDEARTELVAAYDALEYNGGLCKIRSAYTGGYSADKLVYVDAVNNPYFEQATDEYLSKYVWEFVPVKGGYNLKSLHTQSYVTAASWGTQVVLGDEAGAKLVTVDFLDKENGIVRLNVAGGYPLHAQNTGSKLVGYTGGLGTASAWYLDEISAADAKENVKHTVSLGANESGSDTNAYSTLYLAYNAKIPEGITASIVEEINEIGQLVLTPVTGGILPANTAVVLSRETAGDVDFLYTDEEPTFDPTGNMLRGASCNELINCGDEHNVYMLAKKSGRVAFYWTYENRGADGNYVYINADEEIVASTATGAHRNHNKGGYVRCNANKAYLLESENSGQAAAAMYSFFLGGATTELDEVEGENGQVNAIYDLQGRKLVKVTSPGIYIVNGKKVYVTEIED